MMPTKGKSCPPNFMALWAMFPTKGKICPTFSPQTWVQYVRPQGRHTMHTKSRMVGGDSFGAVCSVHLSGPSGHLSRMWIIQDHP